MERLLQILLVPSLIMLWAMAYLINSLDKGWNNVLLVVPVSILTFLLGIIIIVKEFNFILKTQTQIKLDLSSIKKELAVFGLVLLYLLVFNHLGFVFSTFLFFVCILVLLGVHRPIRILSFSVISTLAMQFIFSYLLKIPLPSGILNFWS